MIKKIYRASLLFLFVLPTFVLAAVSKPVPLDRVVAVVNDSVITQSQLNKAINIAKQQLQASGMAIPSQSELQKKVLDQLILRDVQLQLAKRNKMTVSDQQIDEAIANIAAQNHMTPAQLKAAVAKEGLNEAQYRKQLKEEILISQLQHQAVGNNIKVSDQEAANFMRTAPKQSSANAQYHVVDILVPNKQQAWTLLQKLRAGASLKQLQSNNVQVSDLGMRPLAGFPSIFTATLTGMQVGSYAGPVQAPNGYHILKLVQMQGAVQKLTLEDARNIIYQQKFQAQLQNWLKQARNSAYVKVMLNNK